MTSRQKLLHALLPAGVAVVFILIMCRWIFRTWVLYGFYTPDKFLIYSYTYATLIPNYFDHGFIRRGLAGTVMAIVDGRDQMSSAVSFHVFSAFWLTAAIVLILRKVLAADLKYGAWLGLVLVVSPQFRFWAIDIGRTDLLSSGFVAFAVLAALHKRWLLACLIIAAGSLVHETAVIFGAPIVLAAWYLDYRDRRADVAGIAVAFSTLGALLVAVALLQRAFPFDPEQVATSVKTIAPPTTLRDIGVYMTVGGFRTITTSACMARLSEAFPLMIISGFIFIPFYSIVLGYRPNKVHTLFFMVVVLVPMLFLTIVAMDYGRWFILAAFNAWLGGAVLAVRPHSVVPAPQLKLPVAIAALALLAAAGQSEVYMANSATHHLAEQLWERPTISAVRSIGVCDPQWRDLVDVADQRPDRRGA